MRRLKFTVESWSDGIELAKALSIVASLLGFIFLRAYCAEEGVPVPLSIAELPTLLLAVAGLAFCFVVILAGFIMLPALPSMGGARGHEHIVSNRRQSRRGTLLAECWWRYGGPLALFSTALFQLNNRELAFPSLCGWLGSGLLALVWFWHGCRAGLKQVEAASKAAAREAMLLTGFFGMMWMSLMLGMLVVLVLRSWPAVADWRVTLFVTFAAILSVLFSGMIFPRESAANKPLLGMIALFALGACALLRPMGAAFGGLALNAVNLGGRLPLAKLGFWDERIALKPDVLYEFILQSGDRIVLRENKSGEHKSDGRSNIFLPLDSIACMDIDDLRKVKVTTSCRPEFNRGSIPAMNRF